MSRKRKSGRSTASGPVTYETVREMVRELPGAVEGTSYGTPAYRVGKHLFVRKHQDGESLVVKIDPDQRAIRMRADPEAYYITDHYRNYPWMLVRLSTVDPDDLRDLLQDAWRQSAPQRLRSTLEASRGDPRGKPSRKPASLQRKSS
jgi:hypothetical protein